MESGLSFALTHLGGEQTVTGSCHLLRVNGVNILVDCGLAQGGERVAPMAGWPVPPDRIDFLFLTHAHIDYIGRLPELISGGFRGEIITTEATAFLLAPLGLKITEVYGRLKPFWDQESKELWAGGLRLSRRPALRYPRPRPSAFRLFGPRRPGRPHQLGRRHGAPAGENKTRPRRAGGAGRAGREVKGGSEL